MDVVLNHLIDRSGCQVCVQAPLVGSPAAIGLGVRRGKTLEKHGSKLHEIVHQVIASPVELLLMRHWHLRWDSPSGSVPSVRFRPSQGVRLRPGSRGRAPQPPSVASLIREYAPGAKPSPSSAAPCKPGNCL